MGWGGVGVGEGREVRGEGGRGHFIHLAMYCTTTWYFALKGLRTISDLLGERDRSFVRTLRRALNRDWC